MSAMIDRWHDAYHAEAPDYANCPYCQDEWTLTASTLPLPVVEIDAETDWGVWLETTYDPDGPNVDRLEDLEV